MCILIGSVFQLALRICLLLCVTRQVWADVHGLAVCCRKANRLARCVWRGRRDVQVQWTSSWPMGHVLTVMKRSQSSVFSAPGLWLAGLVTANYKSHQSSGSQFIHMKGPLEARSRHKVLSRDSGKILSGSNH